MKKDKLYTANRWNKGQFAKGVDRVNHNIFDGEGSSNLWGSTPTFWPYQTSSDYSYVYSPEYLERQSRPSDFSQRPVNWSDPLQRAQAVRNVGSMRLDTTMSPIWQPQQSEIGGTSYPKLDGWKDSDTWLGNTKYSDPGFWEGWGTDAKNQEVKSGWSPTAKAAAGIGASVAAAPMFNDPYNKGQRTNLYNMADPLWHVAAGRESTVGKVGHQVSQGLFQAGVNSGNAGLMLAGGIGQGVSSLIDAAFGVKLNKENINKVKGNIAGMKQAGHGFNRLTTNSDLANAMGNVNMGYDFSNGYIGKDGWFNSKATDEADNLRTQQNTARGYAVHAFADAANKIDKNKDDMAQINSTAYGGPLDMMNADGMGALGYGFMSDYLNMKNRQTGVKDKIGGLTGVPGINPFASGGGIEIKHPGRLTELKKRTGKTEAELWAEGKPEVRKMITFARNARKWKKAYGGFLDASNTLFALGGDTQMHGGDYTTGLMHIDEGSSHEENPNEGVQLGVDSQGVPNMVEEGETVFNDYVFSNRIEVDAQTKDRFHIGKKKKLTYADLSKRLEKEASERPNDPISKASLKKQLAALQEEQERQKQEMEAKRASEELAAMTPDERELVLREMQRQLQAQDQAALEEQAVQQQGLDQAAQQQAMQQQMMQQQGYGYPDEQAMMQQQMAQQQMMAQQGAPVGDMGYACGGKMNKYDKGGDLKKAIWSSIGVNTESEWDKWVKEHNVTLGDDFKWENALDNNTLIFALSANNPALRHALGEGYNYGAYIPPVSTEIVSFTGPSGNSYMNSGNWTTANHKHPFDGWKGSEDRIVKDLEAALKEQHGNNWEQVAMSMTRPQLEEAFKQTPAYKETEAWLKASPDNMLAYLNAVRNDPNIGEHKSAQKHYQQFITDDGKWKDGVDTTNLEDLYSKIFGEQSGNSGRLFYPGTYWHTPSILNNPRGAKTLNYVVNDDGSVELIPYDVPKEWKLGSTYSWQNPTDDLTYNYYTRPDYKGTAFGATTSGATGQAKSGANPVDANGNHMWIPRPVHQPTWMRYAGVFGPAVGLGLMGAGVGKPDYSNLDAALEIGRGPTALADWMPVHERQWFTPFDIWSQQNRQGNVSAGTDRYLVNNSGPLGMRNAALLANAAQNRQALGALGMQAKEYNNKFNDAVQRFNQSTSLANQQAYDSTSQFNASAMNQGKNVRAQMAMDAARQKILMDQNWAQGIYGNVSGLFKGIGDIGRENYQRNMIADMAAQGIFGPMSPSTYISDGFIDWERNPQYQAAEGGKIRRKKNKRRGGLTY